MKVVVNRAVGRSFCLSAKAIQRLAHKKNRSYVTFSAFSVSQGEKLGEDGNPQWIRDIERNDHHLVQVIEELGSEAAASEAELIVIEIHDTASWHISEVIGYEFVVADGSVH